MFFDAFFGIQDFSIETVKNTAQLSTQVRFLGATWVEQVGRKKVFKNNDLRVPDPGDPGPDDVLCCVLFLLSSCMRAHAHDDASTYKMYLGHLGHLGQGLISRCF